MESILVQWLHLMGGVFDRTFAFSVIIPVSGVGLDNKLVRPLGASVDSSRDIGIACPPPGQTREEIACVLNLWAQIQLYLT